MKLPFGMTKTPEGWPMMTQEFIYFLFYAIQDEKITEQYKTESGMDIRGIFPKSAIAAMVDEAIGNNPEERFEKELPGFVDWLVVNVWGEADNGQVQGDSK